MTLAVELNRQQAAARRLARLAVESPVEITELNPVDLDLGIRLWRRTRLLGRIAWRLRAAGLMEKLPAQAVDQFESALVNAEARRRRGTWELNRLAWSLRELPDVPLIAMKGCAYLLANTPNAEGRLFADVDLLVPEAMLPAVETRLREHGWHTAELTPYDDQYYRRWAHELPPLSHVERDVEVDLHHNIMMRSARLQPSSSLLIAASAAVPESRFHVLAPVDMVLHAIAHLFYGGDMADALRELVDIDDLLRHFSATEPGFWDVFWSRAVALDLARPAFYGLRYARILLGTPVPEATMTASVSGRPNGAVARLMDWLVPRALFPQHPDQPSTCNELARFLLYVRSHWVKMPALMLAGHLAYKFYKRRLTWSGVAAGGTPSTTD